MGNPSRTHSLPPSQPVLLTTSQVLERVPVSESKLYRMIHSGELPAKRLGRRYVIALADLDRWLSQLPDASNLAASIDPDAILARVRSTHNKE